MIIRPCLVGDLDVLETELPSGRARLHHERFVEQERGESTYLITWLDGVPVAHVQIRWPGSVHARVREAFPDVPELRRFEVDRSMRNRGIGGRLLAKAEALVVERGYLAVGLAVGVANDGAQRLYERNGYVDWARGHFDSFKVRIDADGEAREEPHVVTYLVKPLRLP